MKNEEKIVDPSHEHPKDCVSSASINLESPESLRTIFMEIKNYIAGNSVGMLSEEAIANEIIIVLFCKMYDELHLHSRGMSEFYCNNREDSSRTKERMIQLFNKVKYSYDGIFDNDDTIKLDELSVSFIVHQLQDYCLTDSSRDLIGEAFEIFFSQTLKGSQGQFFTPRNVVKTAVKIIAPDSSQKIIDPACGSGGFLIVSLNYVWTNIEAKAKQLGKSTQWIKEKKNNYIRNMICGIDKNSFLIKICKAYFTLINHGSESVSGFFCENSLKTPVKWEPITQETITFQTYDIVLANPPFGSKIPITDEDTLHQFELGHKWKKNKKKGWEKTSLLLTKQSPQVLFIERCWQLLKPGGKCAIILPDGILGGSKIGYVPHWIRQHFNLLAAIDCPIETFSPNTSIKVHLLILEKKPAMQKKTIFMSVPQEVGHSKKGQPIFMETNKYLIKDDFLKVYENWKKYTHNELSTTGMGYSLPYSELENSINAKRYLPRFMNNLRYISQFSGKKIQIKDIKLTLSTGANIAHTDYVKKGSPNAKPYILVKNIQDDGISLSNLKYVRPQCYDLHKKSIVKPGDIIINRCGDVGITALVPEDLNGALVCGFCFILRLKKEYAPDYIVSFLNSRIGRLQLKRLAMGSILEHITKEALENVYILFPDDTTYTEEIIKKHSQAIINREKARKALLDITELFSSAFQ